jgi:AraC-like DNA-binding protein
MKEIPLIRRSAFQQCTSAIAQHGMDPDRVLSRAGIGMWHRGAPDDWVPLAEFLSAMESGSATLGDRLFGVTVAEKNPMHFGAIGQAITGSVSLYSGLRASSHLVNKLNTSSKIWLSEGPGMIWFCRSPAPNVLLEQFVLGHMVSLVQMAAGPEWQPRDVRLSAPVNPELNRIKVFDNAAVRTAQPFLAIAIPKALLTAQIHAGPAGDDRCSRERSSRTILPAEDFVASLRIVIESALADRYPTIDMLSEIVCIPKRSLQRELAREGLTYRALVSQVRYRMACKLLTETHMSIQEIASELSYARDVHFIRAFRHWAGMPPGEFRHHSALKSSHLD